MSKYTVEHSRHKLRERGLPSSGHKGELIERWYDYKARKQNKQQRPSQMEGCLTNYEQVRSERGVIAQRRECKVRRGNAEFTAITEWSMDAHPRGSGSKMSRLFQKIAYDSDEDDDDDDDDEYERRGRGSSRSFTMIDMFGPSVCGSRGMALGWY